MCSSTFTSVKNGACCTSSTWKHHNGGKQVHRNTLICLTCAFILCLNEHWSASGVRACLHCIPCVLCAVQNVRLPASVVCLRLICSAIASSALPSFWVMTLPSFNLPTDPSFDRPTRVYTAFPVFTVLFRMLVYCIVVCLRLIINIPFAVRLRPPHQPTNPSFLRPTLPSFDRPLLPSIDRPTLRSTNPGLHCIPRVRYAVQNVCLLHLWYVYSSFAVFATLPSIGRPSLPSIDQPTLPFFDGLFP